MLLAWKKAHNISVIFPKCKTSNGEEKIPLVICFDCDETYKGEGHREFREWLRSHGVRVKRK